MIIKNQQTLFAEQYMNDATKKKIDDEWRSIWIWNENEHIFF